MRGKFSFRAAIGALGAFVGLAACTAGPDFDPPDPVMPVAYDAPIPDVFEGGERVQGPWWTLFDDRILSALIARGMEENLDIRLAASRVREARALARSIDAETVPQVNASAEAGADWVIRGDSDDKGISGFLLGAIDATLDLDLSGGLTRRRESAWADAARQDALSRDAHRFAAGALASAYIELRAVERQLALTRRALDLQRRTLGLVRERAESGLAPGLDRVRAEAEVAVIAARVGPLESQADALRNALAILVGEPPGALDAMLDNDVVGEIPVVRTGAAVGMPRNLLRRRPDIQAAELAVAGASAEVGVATSLLYPRLVLPGSIQAGRTGLGTESVATTIVASLAALVDVPLFDGGLRRANLTAAEERMAQALILYRSVLLTALDQVESALLDYRAAVARRRALEEAVEKSRMAYRQSEELYREGFASFLDVADSQRQWNEALQNLTGAERDVSLAVARLYTALGGDTAPQTADAD